MTPGFCHFAMQCVAMPCAACISLRAPFWLDRNSQTQQWLLSPPHQRRLVIMVVLSMYSGTITVPFQFKYTATYTISNRICGVAPKNLLSNTKHQSHIRFIPRQFQGSHQIILHNIVRFKFVYQQCISSVCMRPSYTFTQLCISVSGAHTLIFTI